MSTSRLRSAGPYIILGESHWVVLENGTAFFINQTCVVMYFSANMARILKTPFTRETRGRKGLLNPIQYSWEECVSPTVGEYSLLILEVIFTSLSWGTSLCLR